jgi:hypothetical protein
MGLHLVNGKRKQERENKEFRVFVFFFLLWFSFVMASPWFSYNISLKFSCNVFSLACACTGNSKKNNYHNFDDNKNDKNTL